MNWSSRCVSMILHSIFLVSAFNLGSWYWFISCNRCLSKVIQPAIALLWFGLVRCGLVRCGSTNVHINIASSCCTSILECIVHTVFISFIRHVAHRVDSTVEVFECCVLLFYVLIVKYWKRFSFVVLLSFLAD